MKPTADKTLADYVVIALSPALIMALVGSLVFFLVEVLYVGQYGGRLLWVLFFFVFGSVLVARIAIELDERRAGAYGLVLAGVAWLGLQRFIEYPEGSVGAELGWAIHLGLILLIWWSANRLTWDCTMIDDQQDASGEGLLHAAGLEQAAAEQKTEPETTEVKEPQAQRRKRQETDLQAWWRRYQQFRERRRQRPHAPGVWVVYFSLAALPLYGLGQSLIPPTETDRRRYAFWLMSVYVISGLGLLLTTSFLGLRRYLRQKNVQMPMKLTSVWLVLGAAMIACFLACGALLPRPAAEYALVSLPWRAESKEREASRFAQHGDEAGKGEGRQLAKGNDRQPVPVKDQPGHKVITGKDGQAKDGQAGDGQAGDGQAKGGAPSGKDKCSNGKDNRGKSASSGGKDSNSGGGAKDQQQNQDKAAQKDKGADQNRKDAARDQAERKKDAKGEKNDAREKGAKGPGQGQPDRQGQVNPPPPANPPAALPEWISKLATVLKWLVLVIFLLAIAFFVLRALLMFLANFTGWARSLLEWFRTLWGRVGGKQGTGEAAAAPATSTVKRVPFRSFRDPFAAGRVERMSAADLVRYTFEALQAWAADRDLARQPGETPLEFAARLGDEVPELTDDVLLLASRYAGLAYARRAVADDCREPLRRLWQVLQKTARREPTGELARR
jgi:hypothetical protein